MSPIVRFGVLLGGGIALLTGPVSGFFLTRIFLEAQASAQWPHVQGILEKAEVKDVGLPLHPRYQADVEYSYRVDGVAYHGHRIRASDGEVEYREAVEDELKGLIAGQPVSVYFDPERKSRCVLRIGARYQEWALLLVPVGIFVWGILIIRKVVRTPVRASSEQTQ